MSAVASCVATLLPIMVALGARTDENAALATSRSKSIVGAIAALFASFTDAAEYAAAVVAVFGNGARKKDEKKVGALETALVDAKVTALTVKTELSHARSVALNYGNADVRKAAETGLRKAYDAAKPAKVEDAKAAGAGTTKDVGDIEMMGRLLERNGGAACLGMIESYLASKADTIRAGYVHEARAKFGKVA